MHTFILQSFVVYFATSWLYFSPRSRTLLVVIALLFPISLRAVEAAGLPTGDARAHGISADELASLRKILDETIEKNVLPGCSVLIAHRGEIVFKEAFGKFELNAPVRIASDTKPFTTSTVMAVYDQGLVDLDSPLSSYLPEFEGTKAASSTLKQIMSHTAGIMPTISPLKPPPEMTLATAIRELVAKGNRLIGPGEFHYGGTSMDTIARVAEAASKTPFEVLEKKLVWEPLELKQTRFASAADARVVSADAAARGEGRYVACGGGLESTLDDMGVFYQMHLNRGVYNGKRVLSEKSIALMRTPQENAVNPNYGPDSNWGPDYGLGFYLARRNKDGIPQTIHHGGALGSMAWADDDHQIVGVFFSATGLGKARPIIGAVQQKAREILADQSVNAKQKPTMANAKAEAETSVATATSNPKAIKKMPDRPTDIQATTFQRIAGDDDRVSLTELKDYILLQSPRNYFKENPDSIEKLFERLDADQDGDLILEEYRKILPSRSARKAKNM